MPPVKIPSDQDKELTESRLQRHSKKYCKRGVKEIRGRFKGNHLFLEVVKEAKGGFIGRIFKMGDVRGVGKLARLEFLGPNSWKFLIYKYDMQKYTTHSKFKQGTIEDCVDAAAEAFLK